MLRKRQRKSRANPPRTLFPFHITKDTWAPGSSQCPHHQRILHSYRGFKTSKKFTKWLWNLAFHFSSYPASLPVDWEYRKESFSPTSFCYKTVPNMRAEVKLLTMKRERLRGYETTCAHPRYSAPKFSVNSTNLARVRRPRRLQARIPYITTGWLIGVKIAAK